MNFFQDAILHWDLVHVFGQHFFFIFDRKFKIWQDVLENNQQYVKVECSEGALFDCVVYNIYTEEDKLLNFINCLLYCINLLCACSESSCYSMGAIAR